MDRATSIRQLLVVALLATLGSCREQLIEPTIDGSESSPTLLGAISWGYNNKQIWLWYDDRAVYSVFADLGCRNPECEGQLGAGVPDRLFHSFDQSATVSTLTFGVNDFDYYFDGKYWKRTLIYFQNTGYTQSTFGLVHTSGLRVWDPNIRVGIPHRFHILGLLTQEEAGPFVGTAAGFTQIDGDWSYSSFGVFNIGRQMTAGGWIGEGGVHENLYRIPVPLGFWEHPADILIAEITQDQFAANSAPMMTAAAGGKVLIVPGGAFDDLVQDGSLSVEVLSFEGLLFEYARVELGGIVNGNLQDRTSWRFYWAERAGNHFRPNGYRPAINHLSLAKGFNRVAAQLSILFVEIDIKPGSYPNCFNNDGHGVIPVAILGSREFEVTQVDPATVELAGLAVGARGKSDKLMAHIEDTNGDGFDDLVVQIEDVDGSFVEGQGMATLTGSLYDGMRIEGSDSICIVS